jgi:hypothetical protein
LIVAAAAILCGAAPVRQAGSSNLLDALNDAARSTTPCGSHSRGTPVQARIDDVRLDLDDALLQARADARDVVVRGRSDDK